MIKIRELLSWQLTQEPDRHKELLNQLEKARARRICNGCGERMGARKRRIKQVGEE